MQVVILSGGKGSRALPYTQSMPKAMMEVNGRPIIEQVMRVYANHGYTEFILACGYLGESLVDYFRSNQYGWRVQCVNTGYDQLSGDRIYSLRSRLSGRFMLTYCDGLSDLDLRSLIRFHEKHGRIATLTGVACPTSQTLVFSDERGRVTQLREEGTLEGLWINGGFFVLELSVFSHWIGRDFERDIIPELIARGELCMYKHNGFWGAMDTYKDQQALAKNWEQFSSKLDTATWNTLRR